MQIKSATYVEINQRATLTATVVLADNTEYLMKWDVNHAHLYDMRGNVVSSLTPSCAPGSVIFAPGMALDLLGQAGLLTLIS